MNRGELLEEIGRRLVELKGAEGIWEPDERDDALHESQILMVRELELLREVKTASTVIDKVDYSLVTDFSMTAGTFLGFQRKLGLIYFDGVQDIRLTRRSVEWLYANVPTWRTDTSGTPALYYPTGGGDLFNDLVGLYPKPSTALSAALRAHVLLMPARMTVDAHEPFNTTVGTTVQFSVLRPYHYGLVWRTVWLLLGDDEPQLAERARLFYGAAIAKAKHETFAPLDRVPGSIDVVRGYRYGRTW